MFPSEFFRYSEQTFKMSHRLHSITRPETSAPQVNIAAAMMLWFRLRQYQTSTSLGFRSLIFTLRAS